MPYLLQSFGMSGYSSSFEHWKLTSSWVSSYWNSVEHCHLFCQTIRIAILLIVSLLHLVSWNIIVKEHTVRFSTYVVQCHSFHNSWKLSSCDLKQRLLDSIICSFSVAYVIYYMSSWFIVLTWSNFNHSNTRSFYYHIKNWCGKSCTFLHCMMSICRETGILYSRYEQKQPH